MNTFGRMLWNALKSGILGLFLAGAVVFPLVEPYYLMRVVFSLGIVAIGYGINSVITLGYVTTSGMLSEHDGTQHDVRVYALILWLLFFVYFTRRDQRSNIDS